MGNKYDKEFMTAGKEVSEIADSIRLRNKKPQDNNNKKRKLIILLLLLFLLLGIAVSGYLIYSSSRLNIGFYAKNVDAGVRVWGQVLDASDSTLVDILVDNKKETYISFNPEEPGVNGQINRNLTFRIDSKIDGNSIIQFFYEIENRSKRSDLYINYSKAKADDNNFKIAVYYRTGRDTETVALTYYAINGKYYLSEEDIADVSKGYDEISLDKAIKIEKESKMTMRIEVQVYDPLEDASCNCNFAINLINDLYYSSGS